MNSNSQMFKFASTNEKAVKGFVVILLPSPERPIGKWNVKVSLGGAIPKQRQRHVHVLSAVDVRLVHTIKHHIHIRHHSWKPRQQLNQSPDREHRPALHARVVHIHVQPPLHDHRPERRELLRLRQVGRRDPAPSPRVQIVVDPPEELRAFGAGRSAARPAWRSGGVGAVGAASEVGAADDFDGPAVACLVVEALGREQMPRRGVQVVAGDGLGPRREVVDLKRERERRLGSDPAGVRRNAAVGGMDLVEEEEGEGEEGEGDDGGEEVGGGAGVSGRRHAHGVEEEMWGWCCCIVMGKGIWRSA